MILTKVSVMTWYPTLAVTWLTNLSSSSDTGLTNLSSSSDTGLTNLSSSSDTGLTNLSSSSDTGLTNLSSSSDTGLTNLSSSSLTLDWPILALPLILDWPVLALPLTLDWPILALPRDTPPGSHIILTHWLTNLSSSSDTGLSNLSSSSWHSTLAVTLFWHTDWPILALPLTLDWPILALPHYTPPGSHIILTHWLTNLSSSSDTGMTNISSFWHRTDQS